MTKILDQIRSFLASDIALRCVVYLGVILYARQYFFNRSLWLDEACVSLDIINLSINDFLLQPMPYFQAVPFGFLVVEKLLISLWGPTEAVLRLFPLFCGIISLWLFVKMAKIYLQKEVVIIAVLLFVITPSLVYFSSEVKPYYIDVLVLLLTYVVLVEAYFKELDFFKSIGIGLLGGVFIWFSFSSILVLLGIGLALVLNAVYEMNWSKLSRLGVILLCWFASFIIYYLVLLHNFHNNKLYESYWKEGFISFKDLIICLNVFNNVLKDPIGILHHLWIAGLCFLLGLYSFFQQDKKRAFILILPLLIVCLASGLHIYSCRKRLVLFLVPIFILMIVNGIRMISLKVGDYGIVVTIFLIVLFFSQSFSHTFKNLINPKGREESRSIFFYVKEHQQQGDLVYFYNQFIYYSFEYYSLVYYLPFNQCISGNFSVKSPNAFLTYLNKTSSHNRVWVLFGHLSHQEKLRAKETFLHYLNTHGKKIDSFKDRGASVYLFDFSQSQNIPK